MLRRVSAAVVLLALLAAPSAARADLRAGAARADITPPVGTPMFAYTSRSAIAGGHVDRPLQIIADPDQHLYAKTFVPSRGIHTRVQARAIVLESGGDKFALVQADLGGVPYALTKEVSTRVASTGITAERILLSATHTHSSTGPIWPADNGGYAALGGDAFDPRAFEVTAQGIAEAILRADADLREARLGTSTTELTGASRNRAFDEFRRNPDVPTDDAGARAASIDPDLSVVRVEDTRGKPIAVWSNFAIHATSFGDGNLLFSGDNPGITSELVEDELRHQAGGRDVVNVWTNGNEGDISPHGDADRIGAEAVQHDGSDFAKAHLAAERVARGILRGWGAAAPQEDAAPPEIGVRRSFLSFDGTKAGGEPVGPLAVLGAGVVQEGMCAPVDGLAGPGQGYKFPGLAGAGLVPGTVPIAMWRIGGLGVAAVPSEVTKQMGLRIRRALEQQSGGALDRVALAGLSNAYVSYTSTPEEYDACHYEGSFTLFGRQQGPRFLDGLSALNRALVDGEPAPGGSPEPPALGFGTDADTPPRETPDAGTVAAQPAERVPRLGRASMSWQGGDPGVDAPRGATFVELQRRHGNEWRRVRTDASFRDTTERAAGDVWSHVAQLDACDPAGEHRFLVRGVADKGNGPEPYTVQSRSFTVAPATLQADPPAVVGTTARVRARYPDPGEGALFATPRLVQTGVAELRVTPPGGSPSTVLARPDAATGTFAATVPLGSAVTLVAVRDGCGNATA